jgi:hypothetical protein
LGNVDKFLHLTSLDEVADLSQEDRDELSELFPDLPSLDQFILANQHLAEVGIELVLAPNTAYPPQAEAYEK